MSMSWELLVLFAYIWGYKIINKIRDLFKVKLYTIISETKKKRKREKKREREKKEWKRKEREKKKREKRERESARLQIFINPNTDRGVISDPN